MTQLPTALLEGVVLGFSKQASPSPLEDGPVTDDERDLIQHLMRLAWESGGAPVPVRALLAEHRKQLENTFLVRALARANNRLLPGAKLIRSGRPITDIMKKFKKIQRRALKGSMIGFRKSIKANQKSLINAARSSARSAYHR
jgi:hypothetical protein